MQWGLERVIGALAELGDPQVRCPTLHVGGTNGKGSVASTIAAVLSAGGIRTGLYTSPHLCSFRERFQVDGQPLSEGELTTSAEKIRDIVLRYGLTFFEAATVLGFHALAREAVAALVVEVGLGGRLDATNVVQPVVSGVTNVAMDHAEYLGDSLAGIAAEKAGIAKAGAPFVTAETDGELVSVFREACRTRGATFHELDSRRVSEVELAVDHTSFSIATRSWDVLRLTTPLVGAHQAVNAALAVEMLEHVPAELRPSADSVRTGVASVSWPGRGQVEELDGCTWLFDVAHNTAGVRSLVEVLDRVELPRPRVALTGVLGDKDWRAMLPPVFRRVDRAILTQPPSAPRERRWDPTAAADAVGPELPPGYPMFTVTDFGSALEQARAAARGGTVLVTGSCHTVGDALRFLDRCPFRQPP